VANLDALKIALMAVALFLGDAMGRPLVLQDPPGDQPAAGDRGESGDVAERAEPPRRARAPKA
jgi:hypothetical protein